MHKVPSDITVDAVRQFDKSVQTVPHVLDEFSRDEKLQALMHVLPGVIQFVGQPTRIADSLLQLQEYLLVRGIQFVRHCD